MRAKAQQTPAQTETRHERELSGPELDQVSGGSAWDDLPGGAAEHDDPVDP